MEQLSREEIERQIDLWKRKKLLISQVRPKDTTGFRPIGVILSELRTVTARIRELFRARMSARAAGLDDVANSMNQKFDKFCEQKERLLEEYRAWGI